MRDDDRIELERLLDESRRLTVRHMLIRDRIVELRRVRAAELRPNPRNWRTHPEAQRNALQGLLAEVGYADALLARELEDGSLELIDGHLRAETTPDQAVPVLVLDVTEDEAGKLLATLDPLAGMAGRDQAVLNDLLKSLATDCPAVREVLDGLAVAGNELEDGFSPTGEFADDLADTVFALGEYRFTVPRREYLDWQESLRQTVGFEKADIVAEIRRRLGLEAQP